MIKKYIDIEKCSGYWNFMYEYQMKGNWYPCHAIEQTDDACGSCSYHHGFHNKEREDLNQFLAAPTI